MAAPRRRVLCLEYDKASVPAGGSCVVSCNAAAVRGDMIESAGRAFHHKVLVVNGLAPPEEEEEEEEEEEPDEYREVSFGEGGSDDLEAWEKKMKRKRKGNHHFENWDYYAMLELEHLRWRASLSDIKEAYKRSSLRYHPDKCGIGSATAAQRDKIEARYKLIQDAFETLTEPVRRRMHDSTDLPDPKLVESLKAGADFYAEFGPGFAGLERFSEKTPVPVLGGADSPYAQVDGFYDFWFAFKSWREFRHEDEDDTELADCREQKREMERKNAKLREKAKKEETVRIKNFVQAAYDCDPRVKAAAAAEKAAKEAKKASKGAGKREAEAAEAAAKAAAAAQAETEAKKAAEEREGAKKSKELQRKALQKLKKRVRDAAEPALPSLNKGLADVETLCSDLELAPLTELAAALEGAAGGVAAQVELLMAALCKLQADYRDKAPRVAPTASASVAKPVVAAKPWAAAEAKALEKAMKQFPVGTAHRWQVIADILGSGRTGDEVAAFAKASGGATPGGDDYESFLKSRKGSGEVVADGGSSTRGTAFTDVMVGEAAWTGEQDSKLVAAIKANPKTAGIDDKSRWAAIAAAVGGKSASECVKRVTALKEIAAQQKA